MTQNENYSRINIAISHSNANNHKIFEWQNY